MEATTRRYSRGYLPHVEAGCVRQFITWRLADAVQVEVIHAWQNALSNLPEKEFKREFYKRLEAHLDEGHGSRLLENPIAAITVQDALLFGHGERYDLLSWCVMPTHVHCILRPNDGWTVAKIMHSIKSFTAHEINKKLRRSGQLWQDESFDRVIRDDGHFERVANYIEWNPCKAKLCVEPKAWVYSSANPLMAERLATKCRRDAR